MHYHVARKYLNKKNMRDTSIGFDTVEESIGSDMNACLYIKQHLHSTRQ